MRTNIDIDDELMEKAMKATGQRTKRAAVEAALRKVVAISDQMAALDELRGLGWEGDLKKMRDDWTPDVDWGLQDKRRLSSIHLYGSQPFGISIDRAQDDFGRRRPKAISCSVTWFFLRFLAGLATAVTLERSRISCGVFRRCR